MPRIWTKEQRQEQREKSLAYVAQRRAEREASAAAGAAADLPPPVAAASIEDAEEVTVIATAPIPAHPLDDPRAERRARLTGDLPADLAALITDSELEKIESEEIERAIAAKKKQALADVRALASAEARIEHGLIPADVLRSESEKARLAEKIRVRVNLPRGGGALGLRVDGRLFRHGQSYTVTRAEYESMHFTVYRTWLDEIRFRTLDQNERGRSAIDQITSNPPQFEVLA